jgi:glutaredoxin
MKCRKHDLAMGPDGRCVLCRREDPSGASIPARAVSARSLVRLGLGVALLVGMAGTAMLWTRRKDARMAARVPVISFQVAAPPATSSPAAAEPATRIRGTFEERLAERPLNGQDAVQNAGQDELPGTSPADRPVDAGPDAPRTADAGAPTGPSQEQIRAAIRRVLVTVYTTRTSPICAQALAFLAANQIAFVEKDVDANAGYRSELFALNPAHTVPTFTIDGQIVVGFDQERIARTIGVRVEKQLGVKLDVRVPKPSR